MLPVTIGGYRVVRSLGQGATGSVCEARGPDGQRVAIKRLTPELAREPDPRERFLREAAVAASLRHPNIVAVHGHGEDDGVPWLAMEYLEGADLHDLLASGALSLEWKIDVLRQLCEGLAYAHSQGVIHRDVKPHNVRVTPEGQVKLLDFGMARVARSSLTKRGVVVGSLHYMAPEQVEGATVDARADVFSVGALAYEMLAGRRPFEAESLSALMLRITREDADPTLLPATRYSPGLERAVLRALARDRERRCRSLLELRADLARAVRSAIPAAPPPSRGI
jgi:eukaryotic-like serine/threonine-protein kinase